MDITWKQLLNAVNAFIQINFLEKIGVNYIDRLSHAVKVMKLDETSFDIFTKMFDNDILCNRMIEWME